MFIVATNFEFDNNIWTFVFNFKIFEKFSFCFVHLKCCKDLQFKKVSVTL